MGRLTDEQAFLAAEDQWAFCLFVRTVVNVCRAICPGFACVPCKMLTITALLREWLDQQI
jgi:hypothetical protein